MNKTKAAELSVQELEQILAEKKKDQIASEKAAKIKYVKDRDLMIINMCLVAKTLNKELVSFCEKANDAMHQQRLKLDEYGGIRKNSKGGFQLITEEGGFKIRFDYQAIADYDERANKAEELLKDFLQDIIKKANKKAYNMIMALLERNKAGQLEYRRIQILYKFETDYDDPRWKEAIKLFKESFVVKGSKITPRFYERKENGQYELINLNFSSI